MVIATLQFFYFALVAFFFMLVLDYVLWKLSNKLHEISTNLTKINNIPYMSRGQLIDLAAESGVMYNSEISNADLQNLLIDKLI